jgi:ABC-type bacteriocin/lantibiotic exporter with double-glycine peptidase domain
MSDLAQPPAQSAQSQVDRVIRVENVSKVFQTPSQENLDALLNIDLDIRPGEFVTVVGPSGCGKSTLLKLIAGFSPVSAGRILCQGDEVRRKRASFSRGSPWKKTSALALIRSAIRAPTASDK